jgi:hypothetical protein
MHDDVMEEWLRPYEAQILGAIEERISQALSA